MSNALPARLLEFGRCKLNLSTRELWVDGVAIDLQPLVFDLLAYLAENRNRVIAKGELLTSVWRSPYVTDSVVARAIMKARRAIMDDAREPQVLQTVQRKGYRFLAPVAEATQSLSALPDLLILRAPIHAETDLVILPVHGLRSQLDAGLGQVVCLMHHFIDREAQLNLLPLSDALSNWEALQAADDPLRAACDQFAAKEALTCQLLTAADGAPALVIRRGASARQHHEWVFQGADWATLALQALRQILAAPDQHLGTASLSGLSALGNAMLLEQLGQPQQALSEVQTAQGHLPESGWLQMLHARLHFRAGRMHECLKANDQALSLQDVGSSVVLKVRLLNQRAAAQLNSGDFATASATCEQALTLIGSEAALANQRSELLSAWALAALQLGQSERAMRVAEQAVIQAAALGNVAGESQAHMLRGQILSELFQMDRAAEAIERAVQLARASGNVSSQAYALYAKVSFLCHNRRYGAAVEAARQGLALARQAGELAVVAACHVWLFEALTKSEQFDLAAQELELLRHNESLVDVYEQKFKGFLAIYHWKIGQTDHAIQALGELIGHTAPPSTIFDWHFGACLANYLMTLGRLDEARAWLDRLQDDPVVERPLYARAHLAFVEGRRRDCIEGLRSIWKSAKALNETVMDACIDLAWLLMEDLGPSPEDEELASLAAHILDRADDYSEARVLCAAYLLRRTPNRAGRARWDAAIKQARVLSRRHPELTTEDYREALAAGQAPLAPTLLTRLCQ